MFMGAHHLSLTRAISIQSKPPEHISRRSILILFPISAALRLFLYFCNSTNLCYPYFKLALQILRYDENSEYSGIPCVQKKSAFIFLDYSASLEGV